MTQVPLRSYFFGIFLLCIVIPLISAEPVPDYCPSSVAIPLVFYHPIPGDIMTAGSMSITNLLDYSPDLFACGSSCRCILNIRYEDGSLAQSQRIETRDGLNSQTISLGVVHGHTGFFVELDFPECGIRTQSRLIPINPLPDTDTGGSTVPDYCPTSVAVPLVFYHPIPGDIMTAGSLSITNLLDYSTNLFACGSSCRCLLNIRYEDGSLAQSRGIETRDELNSQTIDLGVVHGHTGFFVELNFPECGILTQSTLIPIHSLPGTDSGASTGSDYCPTSIAVPQVLYHPIPGDIMTAGSLSITNLIDYPTDLFACGSSCRCLLNIRYEDGSLAQSQGIETRGELNSQTIDLGVVHGHTGFLVELDFPECGILTQSELIPITYSIGTDSGHSSECSPLPTPELRYIGKENYSTTDGNYIRYKLSVANVNEFQPLLFTPSPDLPACGSNTNSSRTWVSIYADDGTYLYGYCSLVSPGELSEISFAILNGTTPPSSVYISVEDRQCGTISRSHEVVIPAESGTPSSRNGASGPGDADRSSCPSLSFPLEMNTDRIGGDIRSIDLDSSDPCACAQICQDESSCQAFTYVPPGIQGSSAKCWIKNRIPGSSPASGFISGVISDRTSSASGSAVLRAPVQIAPTQGSVFDIYPRIVSLQWESVPGAASYGVEVDCYGCCMVNQWCTDSGRSWDIQTGISGTLKVITFVGKQKGRWRVWAVDRAGNTGEKSPWWEFEYTV